MVHHRMLEVTESTHDFLAAMANQMLGKFAKYWTEYNLYLSCAIVHDPRCTVKFVEYCLISCLALMKPWNG